MRLTIRILLFTIAALAPIFGPAVAQEDAGESTAAIRDIIADQRQHLQALGRGLKLYEPAGAQDPAAEAGGTVVVAPSDGAAADVTAETSPAGIPALNETLQPSATTVAATAEDTYRPLPADVQQLNRFIHFDFDSAVLRPSEKPKLAHICDALKIEPGVFQIIGHTDGAGSPDYNMRLSRLRAEEVKRHLVGECGLPGDRLRALGVGEQHLLDADDPLADENRRVEFQLVG